MKKFIIALVFTSLFSLSVIAGDGIIPTGGRTCPPNQTCLIGDGSIPVGGKTCPPNQTCLISQPVDDKETKPFYIEIFDYLTKIFG